MLHSLIRDVRSFQVRFALDEVGAQYKIHEFSQKGNKPEWYYTINPLGKVRIAIHLCRTNYD